MDIIGFILLLIGFYMLITFFLKSPLVFKQFLKDLETKIGHKKFRIFSILFSILVIFIGYILYSL